MLGASQSAFTATWPMIGLRSGLIIDASIGSGGSIHTPEIGAPHGKIWNQPLRDIRSLCSIQLGADMKGGKRLFAAFNMKVC